MKKLLLLGSTTMLVACSSQPQIEKPKLKIMTREQVISAINECRVAHLKPQVEFVYLESNLGTVNEPISVHCVPFTE
jgi:hypothetical protein